MKLGLSFKGRIFVFPTGDAPWEKASSLMEEVWF